MSSTHIRYNVTIISIIIIFYKTDTGNLRPNTVCTINEAYIIKGRKTRVDKKTRLVNFNAN